jgi:hypothetical protein
MTISCSSLFAVTTSQCDFDLYQRSFCILEKSIDKSSHARFEQKRSSLQAAPRICLRNRSLCSISIVFIIDVGVGVDIAIVSVFGWL